MNHLGKWFLYSIFIGVHLIYSNTSNMSSGYVGHGICGIKVEQLIDTNKIPFDFLQEMFDNSMKIRRPVEVLQPQLSFAQCVLALQNKCTDLAPTFYSLYYVLGEAKIESYDCDEKQPDGYQPSSQTDDVPEDVPGGAGRSYYKDLPPQLQPGWLLERLPRFLSDHVDIDSFVEWFDGFIAEVLRILDEMAKTTSYWMQQFSDILWKLLIVSVVAAVVLLLTPATALAGLAQLAAVALLIISVAAASGIQFDKSKLTPGFAQVESSFFGIQYYVHNDLEKDEHNRVLGTVSVSYELGENEAKTYHDLELTITESKVVFNIYKNSVSTLYKSWAIKSSPAS